MACTGNCDQGRHCTCCPLCPALNEYDTQILDSGTPSPCDPSPAPSLTRMQRLARWLSQLLDLG